MAMMALGIGAGDEVITTPFTFFATGEMIELLGAKAVFADIDPKTYNIDPKQIEKLIGPKTKAIVPVSLYGQCADFKEISEIAARHKIEVIEDAAQSFGGEYFGKKSCALSRISCTSFFPAKPLGGYGDSGACFTTDADLAKALLEIRNHGQSKRYVHTRLGINGRMDTLQAAILLAKLEIFSGELDLRDQAAKKFSKILNDKLGEKIQLPFIKSHNRSAWAQFTIEVSNRTQVMERLTQLGIPTAVHYPVTLPRQPLFQKYFDKENAPHFPVAEKASERVMSLPMHPYLSEADMNRIADGLAAALRA
jgi:UDP-2-acetamido-2-deoxy-ribo-hexuluronate aminotransferase